MVIDILKDYWVDKLMTVATDQIFLKLWSEFKKIFVCSINESYLVDYSSSLAQ